MNGANIYRSKFGNLETIKWRYILFPRSSWPLRFHSSDICLPVSTQNFKFIKQSSNYEFVKKPVESNLSICSML